jgi:hypothetical protein
LTVWAFRGPIVHGFSARILSGNEVFILTRDTGVPEQFYKMLFLLDTHYRSKLLADRHAAAPSSFPSMAIPKQLLRPYNRFVGEDNIIFDPLFDPELGDLHDLPRSFHFVNIECWFLADGPRDLRWCRMVFSAEQEMAGVLAIKSRTDGLNTDRLEGRNCHIWP